MAIYYWLDGSWCYADEERGCGWKSDYYAMLLFDCEPLPTYEEIDEIVQQEIKLL